uniref:Uncharacterized protein n=1 Tax=Caenorhabditis japonica TaxID=281687 RepID=A0A8R1HVQ1_CAEJA
MPVQNGKTVSAKPARSKSTSSAAYTLPSFGNGRLLTTSKNLSLAMKRSISESRGLPKIEYGRSPSREKLADLKDELFQTKKKVANYEIDFKKLNTEMQRLKRDADKRETFLERIVTAQYHPTELNDTNLARTLTNIKQKEMAKENLIEIQHKELDRLRSLLKTSGVSTQPKLSAKKRRETDDYESEEDESDYPEEPAQMKSNGILKASTNKTSSSTADDSILNTEDENDEVFKTPSTKDSDKSKERNLLAKKYADQNAKLKQRLKEVKSNYVNMLEKNKKKVEEIVKQRENSKAVVEKTVEISSALESLQKEREGFVEIKMKNEEKISDLSQELVEAYGEIDALKMENEKLNDIVSELESRVGKLHITHDPDFNTDNVQSINIPRLDMSDIDNAENFTLHEFTERSGASKTSEFNPEHLAKAVAEIVGAHCERLKIITQS